MDGGRGTVQLNYVSTSKIVEQISTICLFYCLATDTLEDNSTITMGD
jgi:hypothetical protein